MLIKAVKRNNGDGVIIFHGDEGKSFRLLMEPAEVKQFAGLVNRLAAATTDRAFDIVEAEEDINIGIYGFRQTT